MLFAKLEKKKQNKTKENKNKAKNHRKHSSRWEIFISIIVTQDYEMWKPQKIFQIQ